MLNLLQNPVLTVLLGLVVGTFLPMLLTAYLPNEKVYKLGRKAGVRFSAKGNKFAGESYEKLENNILGTLQAAYQGFVDGANSDDKI